MSKGLPIVRLAVVLLPLLVFGRVLGHALLTWDDLSNTLWNPHLVPPSPAGLLYFWGHAYADLYVPLTFTLWGLLAGLSTDPWIFHAASLVLHALAALAAFLLLRRLVRDDLAAGAGALLFALHPVQAESVGWMSGAKDVMCGMFSLFALAGYVDFVREPRGSPLRGRALARATLLLVLALLSKPSAVAVPLLALVLDVGFLGRKWTRSLLDLVPWIAVAAIGALVAHAVQPAAEVAPAPFGSRPLIAADALAFYARKIVAPLGLAPDYGRDPKTALAGGPPIAAALGVLAAILLVLFLRRRERDASGPFHATTAAAGLSIAAVAPVLGLVPFDFQRYSTVADHYLYLAMIGPALLFAWLLARKPDLPLRIGAGILLLLCAAKSAAQVGVWRDDETLWRHTLSVNPKSWTAHDNLGQALQSSGRPSEALLEFGAALALNPDDARTHYNLGTTLDALDRTAEALPHLETAVRLSPEDRPSRENLGIALLRSERPEEAESQLRKAIEIEPRSFLAHYYLAGALDRLGRTDEMLEHLKEAVRLNPRFQPARDDLQAVLKARAAGG
jgi:tetratricopeptide (TPR) repeat protein